MTRRRTEDADALELREWIESLDEVRLRSGPERVAVLLRELQIRAQLSGVPLPVTAQTPYANTISPEEEPAYPGDRAIERRIKSLVRWNAMAMVVRANRESPGIGGHISTYASSATLYEVGFNHFFRGRDDPSGGDHVYFQGHASPGIYARAFLEGRLTVRDLENFRRELRGGGGLPSYPHPWLMPEFWEFPTVSMGLGPILALYRARFERYLENRGLREPSGAKVWCFVGDGECDEPESLGAISLAPREGLENLIFVVNCNLQRLDGPVRGNGKIIQELEAVFRGVGWNVIKVVWGGGWDELFARDPEGRLVRRLGEVVDGDFLKAHVEGGAYLRRRFFGEDEDLRRLVEDLSDDELWHLRLGGHDPGKVHAAYRAAVDHTGSPTVILARTIKGYGLGEAGEGRNVTHQQKKLNEEELLHFRDRFDIPIPRERVGEAPFYRPVEGSPELEYLLERRRKLGGSVPRRRIVVSRIPPPEDSLFAEFLEGTKGREVSTTMALVRILAKLLRDPSTERLVVPIVPDEARTFGMEALFRQCGIYSSVGQLYEPVDAKSLLYYREARDGQILEEGITEAGAMSSFVAAGTAHAVHGVTTIPIFLFYSMFGFQRIGDLVWAAADSRARGFLVGATAGRTTLAGEGLQHQDGQSHLLALPVPNLRAYDPAYAYEIAVVVRDGLRRMFEEGEDVFYYLTVGNETYAQPAMPAGVEEGILRGLYPFRRGSGGVAGPKVHLLGSGSILNEVIRAQSILEERFGVAADVWSATSYKALRDDALEAERWNRLHPGEEERIPHVRRSFGPEDAVFVAASDYVTALPDSIARWLPGPLVPLGTDGFGRSEDREALRRHFEVDHRSVAHAALWALERRGAAAKGTAQKALRTLEIDPSKPRRP